MKRILAVLLVACAFAATMVGCGGGQSSAKQDIKIGFIGPLTGTNAKPGASMRQGMQLAIDEINAAGGINGHKLVGIYEDDETNATKGVAAAEKLVNKDDVDLVIGSYSSASVMAHMKVTEKAGVPQIVPVAVGIAITESGNQWIFRNCATNPMQVNQLADFITANYPFKRFAVIHENTDYGKGIAEVFVKNVKDKGLEILATEAYNPGETDFYAQLTKIKNLKPDALLIGGNLTEGSQITRQAREVGIQAQLLGLGGLSTPEFDKLANGSNEDMIVTSYFESETANPLAKKFIEAYMKKYNADPDMFAAATYEAVYIAAEAMKNAGPKGSDKAAWRTKVRDALRALKDLPGVQGPTTFDQKGQAKKDVYIVQWKNHKKVILFPKN